MSGDCQLHCSSFINHSGPAYVLAIITTSLDSLPKKSVSDWLQGVIRQFYNERQRTTVLHQLAATRNVGKPCPTRDHGSCKFVIHLLIVNDCKGFFMVLCMRFLNGIRLLASVWPNPNLFSFDWRVLVGTVQFLWWNLFFKSIVGLNLELFGT